jgi:hypothetical protein
LTVVTTEQVLPNLFAKLDGYRTAELDREVGDATACVDDERLHDGCSRTRIDATGA